MCRSLQRFGFAYEWGGHEKTFEVAAYNQHEAEAELNAMSRARCIGQPVGLANAPDQPGRPDEQPPGADPVAASVASVCSAGAPMVSELVFESVLERAFNNKWNVAAIETKHDGQGNAAKKTIRFADGSVVDVTMPTAASTQD